MNCSDVQFSPSATTQEMCIEDSILVFRSEEDQFVPSFISSNDSNGLFHVHFDDGDNECTDMITEKCKFTTMESSSSNVTLQSQLQFVEGDVLSSIEKHLGNNPFLKHQAQGFDQFL